MSNGRLSRRQGLLLRTRVASCALVLLACAGAALAAEARYSNWDQFFYHVQVPVKAAAPASEVTLLVYHSYPTTLHEVGATAASDTLVVTRPAAVMKELDPTEQRSFTFAVQRKANAEGTQATLEVTLHARELSGAKPIAVTVPLTKEAEQELQQRQSVPVGAMEVRVGGWGNQVYVVYLIPMLLLIAWVVWRWRRLARL